MKPNPILEEIWRIKNDLAQEAGHDFHRFFDNLRQWSEEHPHDGPVVHSPEQLRRLAAERQRARESSLTLKDEPPDRDP